MVESECEGEPGTISPVHRVYHVSEELRAAMRSRRTATGQTVRAFVADAVEHELPALVAALRELGLAGPRGGDRPARLALSAAHLEALKMAAAATGLPACLLLRTSLARAARRKRRRPGGGVDSGPAPGGTEKRRGAADPVKTFVRGRRRESVPAAATPGKEPPEREG